MQAVRSNITRLRTSIKERLPDEENLLGYSGINKNILDEVLESAHRNSYDLAEIEPNYECILLKRKIVPEIDECKKFVNEFENTKKDTIKFDNFFLL